MRKSKIDFISDLLASKTLDSSMKQKFFELAAKEFQSLGLPNNEILKRLEEIEIRLGIKETKRPSSYSGNNLPKYIDPFNLSKFLLAYNQDPILKYTCHNIDDISVINEINAFCKSEHYSFSKHQELIENRYREFQEDHFVNPYIKSLILTYLTGSSYSGANNEWSSDEIISNWKSPDLIEWSKNNDGKVPNPGINWITKTKDKGFKLKSPFRSNLTGNRISYFTDLVIHFKNLFHIRGDNSLKSLIEYANKNEKWKDRISFRDIKKEEFNENIELFTDVDKLIQAYKAIVKLILEIANKFSQGNPVVSFTFKEIDNLIIFSIHHENTIYKKTITEILENRRNGEWFTQIVKNQINGLCDFSVRANFDNYEYAEINLWDGNPRSVTQIHNFQGVEYILKFKR